MKYRFWYNQEPLIINDSAVSTDDELKLFGVFLVKLLKFTNHVNSMIAKCKPAFHAICRIGKAGVNNKSLAYFYQT